MMHRQPFLPLALAAALTASGACAQETQVPLIPPPLALPHVMAEARGESLPLAGPDFLMALADAQAHDIGTGIDASIAQSILTLGSFTGLSVESWAPLSLAARPQVPNAYSQGSGHMYADPGISLGDLARRQFGSERRIAVGLEQQLVDSRNMAANLRLRHASGPLDLRVNVKGNKALDAASQMRLSYDSSAIYNLSHALALGVKARGNLGTFDRFAPATTHDAGAFARLSLLGKGGALSAETGYDVKISPDAPPSQGQMRANLNLRLKL